MAKFTKEILRAGKYKTPDVSNPGSLVDTEITKDRLVNWVDKFHSMKREGLRIPAPLRHTDKAVPFDPFDKKSAKASDNAGFWENLWFGYNEEGTPTLYGTLDAPGDKNDARTLAGKIGKTVKETSIYSVPEFTTGKNTKYEDAILHIACVVNPIEPGQKDFQPYAISMSMAEEKTNTDDFKEGTEGEQPPTTDLKKLLALLKERVRITLPEETTPNDFMSSLQVALMQLEPIVTTSNITKPPEGSKEKELPISMSFTTEQIDVLVKVTNPVTGKPFTKEELSIAATPVQMSQENETKLALAQQSNTILMSHLLEGRKRTLLQRLNGLLARGLDKDIAEKQLVPQINAVQMSFDDKGQCAPLAIESTLDILEKTLPKKSNPALIAAVHNGNLASALNAIAMSSGGQLDLNEIPLEGGDTDPKDAIAALLAHM